MNGEKWVEKQETESYFDFLRWKEMAVQSAFLGKKDF